MPVMKLKMNQNSIFAILLRSPWWVSAGIAAALFTAARLALPAEYAPYAFFVALPFAVIAANVLWKHLRMPSESKVAGKLEALRALSSQEFSAVLEEAFRRDGCEVERIARNGADLALAKGGRVTLVACRRWKVARTGIEPLRELEAARQAHEAHEAIYVAGGEVSETALAFAAENKIRLIDAVGLAQLVPRIPEGAGKAQATR